MKANEVPGKIYISTNSQDGTYYISNQYKRLIEYIRADAFIEKVCEFFDEHLWEYIDAKNANCDTFININSDKLKEDFKKLTDKLGNA